jgi:hypothetical protein
MEEWSDVYGENITKYYLIIYHSGAWQTILRTVHDLSLISSHVSTREQFNQGGERGAFIEKRERMYKLRCSSKCSA